MGARCFARDCLAERSFVDTAPRRRKLGWLLVFRAADVSFGAIDGEGPLLGIYRRQVRTSRQGYLWRGVLEEAAVGKHQLAVDPFAVAGAERGDGVGDIFRLAYAGVGCCLGRLLA